MSSIVWIWNKSVELCVWSTGDFNGRGVSCRDSTKQNLFRIFGLLTGLDSYKYFLFGSIGLQWMWPTALSCFANTASWEFLFSQSEDLGLSTASPCCCILCWPRVRSQAHCLLLKRQELGLCASPGGGPWSATAVVALLCEVCWAGWHRAGGSAGGKEGGVGVGTAAAMASLWVKRT